MAKLSRIELLKQKIKEEKEKKENGNGGNYNSDIYPFWTMQAGQSARVRILEDLNQDNEFVFYRDRLEHKLTINGEDKKVACRRMHGEECPICDLSKKYYDAEGKESKNGKYFYRTKTSLVRVLVIEDPLPPNKDTGETYAGKVCNTQFGYQLMEKIKHQISSDDLGDFYSLEDGYDFIIEKTKNGQYDTYAVGSGFARKPTTIDKEIADTVELIDLGTLLPKDPGFEKVYNMLQAHLTGSDYSEDGDKEESTPTKTVKTETKPAATKTVKAEAKPTPVKEEVEEEEEQEETDSEGEDGELDDLIAQIRERQKNKAKK